MLIMFTFQRKVKWCLRSLSQHVADPLNLNRLPIGFLASGEVNPNELSQLRDVEVFGPSATKVQVLSQENAGHRFAIPLSIMPGLRILFNDFGRNEIHSATKRIVRSFPFVFVVKSMRPRACIPAYFSVQR